MPPPRRIKTFFIRTFGCQMNEHDSSRIERLLEAQGLTRAESAKTADLIIINSCSVRAKPEHKALSEAGRYQPARKNRGARVVLAGCVGQQGGQDLLNRTKYLDGVIGPDAVSRIPAIVGKLEQGQFPVLDVEEHTVEHPCFVPLQGEKKAGVSALVTIMKGCNNFCSYCIVPYVRGREVSRKLDDILVEVDRLASSGCREVVLLGQNVNSYRDSTGVSFSRLLRELDRRGAVDRIRFTTSHPKDLSPELVRAMVELERVCEHVHLGLQSGSDRILQLMNRGHTPAVFLEKALAFRDAIPGISLTTDIIVGFPTETEEDFEQTLEVVSQVEFDQAFSFKYSPRPGTAAAKLADDVPGEVKAERLARLQSLISDLENRSLQTLPGKVMPVLVEGPSLRDQSALTGRTRCNRVVNFDAPVRIATGSTENVRISEVRGHTLWGELDNRPV